MTKAEWDYWFRYLNTTSKYDTIACAIGIPLTRAQLKASGVDVPDFPG